MGKKSFITLGPGVYSMESCDKSNQTIVGIVSTFEVKICFFFSGKQCFIQLFFSGEWSWHF
jgi:hypothetical protein